MSVVGIDFGAKNAVIAAAGRGGVDVILNGGSNRLNPCMVGFDRCRSFGETAAISASSNYRNTVHSMKRLVGLAYSDVRAQKEMAYLPFKCVPIEHGPNTPASIGVSVSYNSEPQIIAVEAVAGMMVKNIGLIAAAKSMEGASDKQKLSDMLPKDWVIAVPGYYTDAQKRAFLTGCEVSGVEGILRLMHETTATALAYGIFKDIRKEFTKEKPTHVLFLDLGATSFGVSIVAFEPGKLIVKSTQYDEDLGGRDFDMAIANWFASKFEEKFKGKLSGKPMEKPKVAIKLLNAAEKAKKTLSPFGVKEVRINVECIMDDKDFGISLTSTEYERMCEPYLNRLEAPIQRALIEAGVTAEELSSVEVVGGGTRVGCVKRRLADILKLDKDATNNGLSTTMNADESVARGATLQSAILSPRFKVLPYEIIEYQLYPVKIAWDAEASASSSGDQGIEVEGEAEGSSMPTNSVVMFERGSNFSCVRRVALRRAGQFNVTASYDESSLQYSFPRHAPREIATFSIDAPSGCENKIRVNVKQDIHGTITLSSAQMVQEIEEEESNITATKEESKEETKKEPPAEPATKKKKIKKTNLDFTISRPMDWTKAEKDKAYEAEVQMENTDRIERETVNMRNELESYLYEMRDNIVSESKLEPFCTDGERAKFQNALESTENWLYEDGFDATKSVYGEKLKIVKKMGDPIQTRYNESQGRPTAVKALQRNIEKYKTWLNSSQTDEKYKHITDVERQTCHTKTDETSSWLYTMLDDQGAMPQCSDPVLVVKEIHAKSKELGAVISPIMHKPPPKPKVEKKKEEASKKEEKKEEETKSEPQPMDTSNDIEGEKNTGEPMDTE